MEIVGAMTFILSDYGRVCAFRRHVNRIRRFSAIRRVRLVHRRGDARSRLRELQELQAASRAARRQGAGTVYSIPAGSWAPFAEGVTFRALPIYDSPTLIAERGAIPREASH